MVTPSNVGENTNRQGGDNTPPSLPDSVKNWLKDFSNLKGVPFNYLVPDEKMLPVESIRFFQMDEAWIQALLDRALSIGRISIRDHENDKLY